MALMARLDHWTAVIAAVDQLVVVDAVEDLQHYRLNSGIQMNSGQAWQLVLELVAGYNQDSRQLHQIVAGQVDIDAKEVAAVEG